VAATLNIENKICLNKRSRRQIFEIIYYDEAEIICHIYMYIAYLPEY